MLKHAPHAFHKVSGKPPVAKRIKVAKIKLALQSHLNPRGGHRDFPCHECETSARRFMVEQDAVRRKEIIGLTIVLHRPECVKFCNGVGRTRIERRCLLLRDLLHLSMVPSASTSPVYPGMSNETRTWLCAARL